MKIKSIRLNSNYKRFFDLTIDLGNSPKKIIALVGANGSGKSSVFDGMLFLNHAYQTVGNTGSKDNSFHSMDGQKIEAGSIQIYFDDNNTYPTVRRNRESNGTANTIFSFRNSYRYSSTLNITALQAIPDSKLNNTGASSSVDLDNKIEHNYQRLYSYIDKRLKSSDLTFQQVKHEVLGELNTVLSACLGLEIVDHGDITDGKGTLFFGKKDQLKAFDFNVLSSGEKEVVDILLDVYLKKNVFNDSVYLIDEPELHLNTKIQKSLLLELDKLIPDNCQLWIATHSIGFLNALQNELSTKSDVIYFTGNYAQETVTLTPIKKTRNEWKDIFSTALEDLTGLVSPKTIIYCEGKPTPTAAGKEAGIDAQVYNKIFELEKPDVFFISSGGSTEPDIHASLALKILGKAFSGVELLLLKDKDIRPDGSETTDQDRNDFLAISTSNRMLNRKEFENYLFDFEIVSKAHSVSRTDYDQIFSGQTDYKSKTGELMKLCGIRTGMNKDQFKLSLAAHVSPDTKVYQELLKEIFN